MDAVHIERDVPTSKLMRFREKLREVAAWSIQIERDEVKDVAVVKALVPKRELDRLPTYEVP